MIRIIPIACVLGLCSAALMGQYVRPEGARGLPREHEYQRQLRAFWGSLTAADFTLPDGQFTPADTGGDPDEQLRTWALSLDVPRIGAKRSAPSLNTPPEQFLLSHVESPDDGTVIKPSVWPEPVVWLTHWRHPGNPYFGSRAAKLRAFVVAAQGMMLLDEQHEHNGQFPMWRRADWLGPHLLTHAYTYAGVKDALPAEAQAAFETGLKKLILRACAWGPKGEETYLDMTVVTAMVIADKAMKDPELTAAVEAYIRSFFTPGEFYNSAGYFPDQGCFDPGFNGLTLYFATWAALADDRPWVKHAVREAWKLRGYLILPEPDADTAPRRKRTLLGPTHMTLRTGSHVSDDQWNWPFRAVGGAFLTDEAMCQVDWPDDDELAQAPDRVLAMLTGMKDENPINPLTKAPYQNQELQSIAWSWRLWPSHGNFPMTNFGYDYYPPGMAARRNQIRASTPELLELPFDRKAAFVQRFGDAFLIAKTAGQDSRTFGVIIHTGPISQYPGREYLEYPGAPYGLSGGTLSAFWTPATGSVILGRRGGMFPPGGQPKSFDDPERWRDWPVHAVIGAVEGGHFFTSARQQNPKPGFNFDADDATVTVTGDIPASPLGTHTALQGKLTYQRTFTFSSRGLSVQTAVTGDGADRVIELYEAVPVFHREAGAQPDAAVATTIECLVGDAWHAVTTDYTPDASAVRLTRFSGAVVIRFDQPRRVKLSPAETAEGFLTRHVSRNLLIDLLGPDSPPASLTQPRKVSYTIAPVE